MNYLNNEQLFKLQDHLKDLIDFEGYDNKINTLEQVGLTLWNESAKYQSGTIAQKFTESLRGLPSYINLPYWNNDIENLMHAIGYEGPDPVNTYWNSCGLILAAEVYRFNLMNQN